MSQINIKKTETFAQPPSGSLGYGFDDLGNPCIIKEDGSKKLIPMQDEESNVIITPNVIANRGIGLEANLPAVVAPGDIYVSNDTYKVFTAVDSVSWAGTDLIKGQMVTSGTSLYQFTGAQLFLVGGQAAVKFYSFMSGALSAGVNTLQHDQNLTNYSIIVYDMIYQNEAGVEFKRPSTIEDPKNFIDISVLDAVEAPGYLIHLIGI